MPSFDLRYFHAAEYQYDDETKTVSYGTVTPVGDAMSANLELRFAEGRLYAEGKLAEYMKLATGGTVSLGAKYIKPDAQALLYGATKKTRTVGSKSVEGLAFSAKDSAKYVGVSFYAPDVIDSVPMYTCMFVSKALFGPPSYSYATKGQNITFQTPTTTGEFLADDTTSEVLIETAIASTIEEAQAWCEAVFGKTA